MAVILQMTYMKKLGLPNFSSHSCAVSLTVEIADASVAAQESTKLYALLQTAVDNEIQQVGFMPDATTYGMNKGSRVAHGSANGTNGNGHSHGNGNGHHSASVPSYGDRWNCTEGQKGFILRIIAESRLEKQDVEDLAQQLFGTGVRNLDKMQASQLIEELLEKTGKKNGTTQRRWSRQQAAQFVALSGARTRRRTTAASRPSRTHSNPLKGRPIMQNPIHPCAGVRRAASCALRIALHGAGLVLIGTGTALTGTGRVLKICGKSLTTCAATRKQRETEAPDHAAPQPAA